MWERQNKLSTQIDLSAGKGEFKGFRTDCSFEKMGGNEDQELWYIKDKKTIPGNVGYLTGEDVSRLVAELMKTQNIVQILAIPTYQGALGGAIILTSTKKP